MIQRIGLAILALVLTSYTSEQQPTFNRGLVWENNRYNLLPIVYPSSSVLPSAKSLKQYYPRVVIESRLDVMGVAWAAMWNARTAAEAIACNQTNATDILKFAFAPAYNYALVRKGGDCS